MTKGTVNSESYTIMLMLDWRNLSPSPFPEAGAYIPHPSCVKLHSATLKKDPEPVLALDC